MSKINPHDGQYALDCWIDASNEGESDATDFAEEFEPLKRRAEIMIQAGRYAYIEVNRWNAGKDDWDTLATYEA